MTSFTYLITDSMGLHIRPAGILVKAASKFSSLVEIETEDGRRASLKKIFAVMSLGVPAQQTIKISADGDDEKAAITELKQLVEENL